jgi:hypothetical protein
MTPVSTSSSTRWYHEFNGTVFTGRSHSIKVEWPSWITGSKFGLAIAGFWKL